METGQCPCKPGVIGRQCNRCDNPFAEVTVKGCEGTSYPASTDDQRGCSCRLELLAVGRCRVHSCEHAAVSRGTCGPSGVAPVAAKGAAEPKRACLLLSLCQYDSWGLRKKKKAHRSLIFIKWKYSKLRWGEQNTTPNFTWNLGSSASTALYCCAAAEEAGKSLHASCPQRLCRMPSALCLSSPISPILPFLSPTHQPPVMSTNCCSSHLTTVCGWNERETFSHNKGAGRDRQSQNPEPHNHPELSSASTCLPTLLDKEQLMCTAWKAPQRTGILTRFGNYRKIL